MRQDPQVLALLAQADVLIPIPLSAPRMRERGYNQAAQLARQLAPQQCLLYTLQRCLHTTAQSTLTRSARLRNLQHAFTVPTQQYHHLQAKQVLLVDDVFTTGATLAAASHCLLQAGAAQVNVLCLARTP